MNMVVPQSTALSASVSSTVAGAGESRHLNGHATTALASPPAVTLINEEFEALKTSFTNDLWTLFQGVLREPGGKSGHMIKYDYLDTRTRYRPHAGLESGASLWDRVFRLGPTSKYTIPENEAVIIDRNSSYFSALFPEGVTICELGPGGNYAVQNKTLPVVNAIISNGIESNYSYIGFDQNRQYAESAAGRISQDYPGIDTKAVHSDFTLPYQLNNAGPTLFMMWGLTITQFPFVQNGEKTLADLLKNLGDMANYNGLLIATIDTNQYPAGARDTYTGEHFREFKLQLWRTAKKIIESTPGNLFMAGNDNEDPADSFEYVPRFEKARGGIVHSFLTNKSVTLRVGGRTLTIPQGSTLDTGYSEKKTVREIESAVQDTGWEIVHELTDGQSTIRALVLAAKNTSPALISRAQLG